MHTNITRYRFEDLLSMWKGEINSSDLAPLSHHRLPSFYKDFFAIGGQIFFTSDNAIFKLLSDDRWDIVQPLPDKDTQYIISTNVLQCCLRKERAEADAREGPVKGTTDEAAEEGGRIQRRRAGGGQGSWKLAYWKYALVKFKCNGCRERDWANREKNIKVLEDGYTRTFDDYCPTCRDANIAMTNVYYARFKAPKKDIDDE
ncbi:hypothetical protein AAVH_25492 [Aphelenchoides avenae]|nr:hypothetical protein AAVH_25492 [Aphelenchus avenae]